MKIICPNPAIGNITPATFAKVDFVESISIPRFTTTDPQIDRYHALWRELHTKQDPSQEWFSGWVSKIPQISCGCREWLVEYIKSHPPRFEDWFVWGWELHNAVNDKLGKPQLPFLEAQNVWLIV